MRKFFSVLLAAGALVQPMVGEAARENPPTWWFNLGMGTATNFANSEASLPSATCAELSFNGTLSPHSLLTIYSAGFTKGTLDYNAKHQGDMGVMYGYVSRKPSSYWSASAGLCYYELTKETTTYNFGYAGYQLVSTTSYTNKTKYKGAGVPLEMQAFWTPFKHFGLGLVGHAVVSEHPSTMGMFAIQVF